MLDYYDYYTIESDDAVLFAKGLYKVTFKEFNDCKYETYFSASDPAELKSMIDQYCDAIHDECIECEYVNIVYVKKTLDK